jgi:hypothetical protein
MSIDQDGCGDMSYDVPETMPADKVALVKSLVLVAGVEAG